MEEKRKVSRAQMKAVYNYEKKNYFRSLVRFPADMEEEIKSAAGDSINAFIIAAVREKLDREKTIDI